MSDVYDSSSPAGFRLQKLEVLNWGTFDSTNGTIHIIRPECSTTLLVGENGSGKSTLVDALLTLLVRPVVRNYNVAAGAKKQERDERSYIKGAYGRIGRDDEYSAEIKYLRPEAKHYTALLACFRNDLGDTFTLAQMLFLNGEGHSEKVYCFCQRERSLGEALGNLSAERVKQQIEKRGFKATGNYSEYFGWLQKHTGVRHKAMDVLNQTVAVKDIQSLNHFIRDHMLEPSKWSEKIDALQNHFQQLSEAHHSLVQVRTQRDLLLPVAERGAAYQEKAQELERFERLTAASETYFCDQTLKLLEPECDKKREDLGRNEEERHEVEQQTNETDEDIRSLKNEIENAGGARLKEIPHLIRHEELQTTQKRAAHHNFQAAVTDIGLDVTIADDESFGRVLAAVPQISHKIEQTNDALDIKSDELRLLRSEAQRDADNVSRELASLEQRQGNLPEWASDLRHQITRELGLPEKDLPFVAELVAVAPEEQDWEASIELVLHSFALSLLVPVRHYRLVTTYVDRHRLRDGRGRGQRLIYLRVGERSSSPNRPPAGQQSLLRKLRYQQGHNLLPWVRAELEERFDFLCCTSIDEFQEAHGNAITRDRHIKWPNNRHQKDDREHVSHPSNFVLGWDNAAKRQHLAVRLSELRRTIAGLDGQISSLREQLTTITRRRSLLSEITRVASFDAINFRRHEQAIESLRAEKEVLESGNKQVQFLKARLRTAEATRVSLQARRDRLKEQEFGLKQWIEEISRLITNSDAVLRQRQADGSLKVHQEMFGHFELLLKDLPLSADNLFTRRTDFEKQLRDSEDNARRNLKPLFDALSSAMLKYLREFTEEEADLGGTPDYLSSFLSRLERIERDDLPRHERRFKEHLNQKVTHEIGLLHAAFQTDKNEIETKISQLNRCLGQLEYNRGTYMRLDPLPVRDSEVVSFQEGLKECLSHTFEGSFEADEARYVRIEKFLSRLRDEDRWRERVTDVRRWFDFAARELEIGTNKERSYYQDSSGQSGGEKAKLAFTILVAAIAYQYDIDPNVRRSDRFQFVVIDEMFSKMADAYSEYALNLFRQFGLQLLIVAPLDAKARVTEPYVGCYLHAVKDANTSKSVIYSMTAQEFEDMTIGRVPATIGATN